MSAGETIAIFGGSFDPPHAAHVMLAAYVLAVAEVDRLLVVPNWRHPLGKRACSTFEDRFRMCELAFVDLRRVEISRIEEELGGPSLTLRTVEELRRRMPDAALRLVIGADILGEADRWHRFDRVAELAPPLVVRRSGHPTGGWDVLPVELPPIRSTEIRDRLAAGESVEGLVPRAVLRHASKHGLYRGAGGATA